MIVKAFRSLTGRVPTLNQFMYKSSNNCRKFFKAIKGVGKMFVWTTTCVEALKKLNEQLGSPALLAKPIEDDTLILYLCVSDYSISDMLVREDVETQIPIYYVSKKLLDCETRYTNMEKLLQTIILASRRLMSYFQAHRVEVQIACPLRHILDKPEAYECMLK